MLGMGIHEWKTPSELQAAADAAARAASRIEWDDIHMVVTKEHAHALRKSTNMRSPCADEKR